MNKQGFTVAELLVTIFLAAIISSLSVYSIESVKNSINEINNLRKIRSLIFEARYTSMGRNSTVKIVCKNKTLKLYLKNSSSWVPLRETAVDCSWISLNTEPLFFPQGYVVPLFSINIRFKKSFYKISVSFNGKIKTTKLYSFI